MVESSQATEQLTICKMCAKPIVDSKFRMHEVQCLKLNRRCPQCDKVVLKSDFEQHVLDEHTEKPKVVLSPPQLQPSLNMPASQQPILA